MRRVLKIGQVVALSDLVAHVQKRHTKRRRQSVRQRNSADSQTNRQPIVGADRPTQTGERRRSPAGAFVASFFVDAERCPLSKGAGKVTSIEVSEERPMQCPADTGGGGVIVVDRPTDVVVAANVRRPPCAARRG